MTTIEQKCPNCGHELELKVWRWDSVAVCPSCYRHLEVKFDFSVGGGEDEYDFYELALITQEEFFKRRGQWGSDDWFSETKLLS